MRYKGNEKIRWKINISEEMIKRLILLVDYRK